MGARILEALGGEEGCRRLSKDFYTLVGQDPVLRPLFPGKSLRCATEEFAAFLIQFLGGDEEQTQKRWWLSLRESHARFKISPEARIAWLGHMRAALAASGIDGETQAALQQFFFGTSTYVSGESASGIRHAELAEAWQEQRNLDDAVAAIAAGRDEEGLSLAAQFRGRPTVLVGLLKRMLETGRPGLLQWALECVESDPSLGTESFGGRTLLHLASAAGCLEVVELLLRVGTDPNLKDEGDHTPLYAVANGCASESGIRVVEALLRAGAEVNAYGGVTGATPLHMAARRGHKGIASALIDGGAEVNARDRKGDTALQRALNCRQERVAALLVERGARR